VTGRGGWSPNRLWKGEAYIGVSAGGITIVYSVAVSFSCPRHSFKSDGSGHVKLCFICNS